MKLSAVKSVSTATDMTDLEVLDEVIMKAQGRPYNKATDKPVTGLIEAILHTLIEEVCDSTYSIHELKHNTDAMTGTHAMFL